MIRVLAILSVLSVFLVAALGENAFSKTLPTLTIENAWAPPSLDGAKVAVAFAALHNNTGADIEITRLHSSVSNTTELHNHVMEDGAVKMRRVEPMVIEAHSTLAMKPGGLHLMLIGLTQALKDGERLTVTFETKDGEAQAISFPISQARLLEALKSRSNSAHEH